ncbi:MAG: hypothetical protein QXQ02_05915 [Halobacteria archaeon]
MLEARDFIARETQLEIEINPPSDPENKRRFAFPLRPAIYIK